MQLAHAQGNDHASPYGHVEDSSPKSLLIRPVWKWILPETLSNMSNTGAIASLLLFRYLFS